MDPLEVLAEKRAQEAQTPDAPSAAEAAREGGLDMTPSTEAGRALLEQEKYNSRSFTLISAKDIIAIEQEAVKPWRKAIAQHRSNHRGMTRLLTRSQDCDLCNLPEKEN